MASFSSLDRRQKLENLKSNSFDLLIIGGGVTGAGIALDASARGLKVALIEKNDFASGTSSRSTKLIHGGLRYLKQLEVGLVREVGQERSVVHKLAPHLVIPEKMLLPFVEGGTLDKWSTSVALWVYDFLAGVTGEDKRKMLTKEQVLSEEPLIKEAILKGGGIYAEYRTDDARLTIEIAKLASQQGAECINYVKANDFEYTDGKITGTLCQDTSTGEEFTINSEFVVSAAGPWVDTIRKVNKSMTKKHLYPTKGVHIVLPFDRLPLKHSVYFDVADGRMIFAIPRNRITYVGTTDTAFKGNLDEVKTNQEDVDYLIKAVNNLFPTTNIQSKDVVSSWAGLRPLIFEEGKSASELSRKDEIFESDSGLISIAGGKLTGYRKMAERIVDLLDKRMPKELKPCETKTLALGGGPFNNAKEVSAYIISIEKEVAKYGLQSFYASYLVYNYGRQSELILDKMKNFEDQADLALARAELEFCVKNEQVFRAEDFFTRRSGRTFFNIDLIPKVKDAIIADMAQMLNWDQAQIQKENNFLDKVLYECANFEYSESTSV